MQTTLSHVLFNVEAANIPFYREMLSFLGWKTLYDGDGMLGMGDTNSTSLWFGSQVKPVTNDYDGPGVNHLALHTTTQDEVDSAAAYLTERGVPLLFETPRHRPEFSSEDSTYYQIMFETPDRILLEVVYTGPKAV